MTVYCDLKLRVLPRSGRNEWGGRRGEARVVRLTAPPVEGAANEGLLAFLHQALGVPRGDLEIVSGPRSRDKVVRVWGMTEEELEEKLP